MVQADPSFAACSIRRSRYIRRKKRLLGVKLRNYILTQILYYKHPLNLPFVLCLFYRLFEDHYLLLLHDQSAILFLSRLRRLFDGITEQWHVHSFVEVHRIVSSCLATDALSVRRRGCMRRKKNMFKIFLTPWLPSLITFHSTHVVTSYY